ncbi:MAG TPA: M48 family metallopeptidase [Caulobacteraceae bacterium]|nr:M48 family metallopeptidase [Caulobacteraceae bacterium]
MCLLCPGLPRRALLIGLTLAPLAACSDNPLTGRRQLAFVPDAQLAQLADQAWAELRASTPVSRDEALHARLAAVAEPLVRATGRNDLAWEFVVFDSPDLNAFVLPNGKVGVFRGMMEFARDEHELGAVVGHEAAHILARHPAERVSQQLASQVGLTLAQLVFGGENGENAELVAGVFGLGATYGVLLPYSRAHELEADRLGVALMEKAGLNPLGAVRFWERMVARQARQGAPPEALSTHPADQRRLAELRTAVTAATASA